MRFLILSLTFALSVTTAFTAPKPSETYSNLFSHAEFVVIATPIGTQESNANLEFSEIYTDTVTTVATEFEVAYVLKGTLSTNTFTMLHLNLKKETPPGKVRVKRSGQVGSYFIDFDSTDPRTAKGDIIGGSHKSYMLFMTRRPDGYFCPAWDPMQGARAIIPLRKDGEL